MKSRRSILLFLLTAPLAGYDWYRMLPGHAKDLVDRADQKTAISRSKRPLIAAYLPSAFNSAPANSYSFSVFAPVARDFWK
jgi:hypothetical protein